MKSQKNKGFSLIELLIVVAIIGLLSSVAIPHFQRFQTKARQAEVKGLLGGLYISEKAFQAEWEVYYGDLRDIGFSPTGKMKYVLGFASAGILPAAPFQGSTTGCAAGAAFNTSIPCAIPNATAPPIVWAAASDTALCPNGLDPGTSPLTFVATAIGSIGGAVDDVWTLDGGAPAVKTICNNISGL